MHFNLLEYMPPDGTPALAGNDLYLDSELFDITTK